MSLPMYLSKLVLNERHHRVYRDLGNAHALHQRIMQGFPDESREQPRFDWHILYRYEPDNLAVLVQSTIQPDWNQLPEDYLQEVKCHSAEVMAAMVQNLKSGRRLQFRLRANPSKRDAKTGKVLGIFRQADQVNWLDRKGTQHGFRTHGIDTVSSPNILGFKGKGKPPIKITTVLYQGVLEILDVDLFTRALVEGIGRGRSYGCGLLSIARWN